MRVISEMKHIFSEDNLKEMELFSLEKRMLAVLKECLQEIWRWTLHQSV